MWINYHQVVVYIHSTELSVVLRVGEGRRILSCSSVRWQTATACGLEKQKTKFNARDSAWIPINFGSVSAAIPNWLTVSRKIKKKLIDSDTSE